MTIFGKVLLALILITGAILLVKNGIKGTDDVSTDTESATGGEVTTTEGSAADASAEESASAEFNGSMKELVARGGDYMCTFTQTTDVADSSGTVYISGERLRGDFKSHEKVSDTDVESHMIRDGGFAYVWSSAMPTGFKMVVDDSASTDSNSTGFDYNQQLDYSCNSWTVDESQFSLPAGVEFTTLPTAA